MSAKRQTVLFDPRGEKAWHITTLVYDYPDGYVVPEHFHDRDQVVYASRGVMAVRTWNGSWVVPPQRAVWIPANIPHGITMHGRVSMRTLYLRPRLARGLPRACRVLNVQALLRELVLHACKFPGLSRKEKTHAHLIDMILDQLETVQSLPLELPNPADKRALRVAQALLDDPGDQRTLSQICKGSGASKRTIERLFQQETGITFGRWRQQLRLMYAIRLIAGGAKVTSAALDAGYSTPSAFISMFRSVLGTTPGQYFRDPIAVGPNPLPLCAK
jgi:AraC-like DNA-binding protein